MNLKVLSSSSSGNSYILATDTGSLLIEAGIPWGEMKKGLEFNLNDVVGCLVSHSHKDHSKAICDVLRAGIDVYTGGGTICEIGSEYGLPKSHRLINITSREQFTVKDFMILPFEAEHDCRDPLGFLIHYKPTNENLLFLTDSYYCKYRFNNLNYIMLECNYCKDTLDQNVENGKMSIPMKNRLLTSHFSLEHVKQFLAANDLSNVKELILLHLSDRNSDSARMIREIKELTGISPRIAYPGLLVDLELVPY